MNLDDRIVDDEEDFKSPRDCHWCGVELNEGEVFVFETEAAAIVYDETFLVEHGAVSGNAGLHAACDQCRRSMINNHEEMESEENDVATHTSHVGTLCKRWLLVFFFLSILFVAILPQDLLSGYFLVVMFALGFLPVGFTLLVFKALARQSESDWETRQ